MSEPPERIDVVKTLADAFKWVEHDLAILESLARAGRIGHTLKRRLRTLSLSTSFSGTGGPENAVNAIEKAIRCFYGGGDDDLKPQNDWAVEWFDESRAELQMLPNAPKHIFTDITAFLRLGVQVEMRELAPHMSFDKLRDLLIKGAQRLFTDAAYCVRCRKYCKVWASDLHVAGTPCVAWSSFGTHAAASGPTVLAFMVWILMRRRLQEPAVLHENVPDFEAQLLQDLLGDLYVVSSCVVSAAKRGQLAERERRFTWLLHKKFFLPRVQQPLVPWDLAFVSHFTRSLETTWRVVFELATEEEIKEEVLWASRRKECVSEASEGLLDAAVADFSLVLSGYEAQNLRRYEQNFGGQGVCNLLQNPLTRPVTNSTKPYLQTLIRNCFPMYSHEFKRWLTGRESLATNCYVSYPCLSQHGEQTSFMFDWADFGLPPRQRHHLFAQAGDGMSLPCVGLALLWYLHLDLRDTAQESLQVSPFLRKLTRTLTDSPRSKRARGQDGPC